jgi:small subunit ribosomal protein S15Ae
MSLSVYVLDTSFPLCTLKKCTDLCAGYIGEFEEIDDHRSGKIVIQLNGRLNKCGVISPRFNIRLPDLEKWVNQLLPARSIGYVVLTTSAGIMDHEEARRKHVAGKILGFFY